MNAEALLADLRARGATFRVRDGAILVRAPVGVLTETDRAILRQYKTALLHLLAERAQDHPPPPPAFPARPCPTCGGRRWWAPCPDDTYTVCAVCHPPPDGPLWWHRAPWYGAISDGEFHQVVATYIAACGYYEPTLPDRCPEPLARHLRARRG